MDSLGFRSHSYRVLSHASSQPGAPRTPAARPELLHQFFERQAALSPGATAVACGSKQITYGELEQRANQLAHFLNAQGIGKGSCVALLLTRSELVYIALLGVLKAGAAYVPIDPDYPTERVSFILADSAAALLFSSAALVSKASGFRGKVVILEEDGPEPSPACDEALNPAEPGTAPEDLCYIIYTSGTTGRPKGVQIEHRSAVHLVQIECEIFQVRPADRVFQGFSIAFDASIEEIWLALATGAALVVGTTEMVRSGPALSRLLAEGGVTVLSCVPTLLAMMETDVPGLRLLILGGEICGPEIVKRWWKPNRRVINTYGPTEATVIATYAECHPDKPVTIGRALPGYDALVLNEKLELAARGEVGELVLGGVGLARGYLGQPELTKQKFIFRSLGSGPVQRFYRTGDLARWTETQELEFLGRLDTQVKIRGFRVELSEIDSVLLECAEIQAAATVLHQDPSGAGRLMSYVVPRSSALLDTQALRGVLKARLPAYMVPASIRVLPLLPTLASGKVDRQALSARAPNAAEVVREVTQATTLLERHLVEVWTRVCALPAVSITDDFFLDLGGHSLLAAQMVSELRGSPACEGLSMADVYRFSTVESLARELENRRLLQPKRGSTGLTGQGGDEPVLDNGKGAASPPPTEAHRFSRSPAAGANRFPSIPFWRHFSCGAAQLFSLVFVLSFFALQWLAPYLTYTVLIEEEYDFLPSILAAFASLVLLYPLMLSVAIGLKWLIIGRYKPGTYPLWGWYYFRFWLVTAVEATVPVGYLSGTPLLCLYLRLMGARVGRNVFLQSDNFAIYDLLSIGEDSSINADASLLGYSVSDGWLRIGSVTIGKRCFVGTRSAIGENASMGDGSVLEDLSLLSPGQSIGREETWRGSPSEREVVSALSDHGHGLEKGTGSAPQTQRRCEVLEMPALPGETPSLQGNSQSRVVANSTLRRLYFGILHGLGVLVFPVLVVAALFPGIAVMNRLNYLDPYYWYLLLSPLVAVSFVSLLCLEIVVLKWTLLGRIRPGPHRLDSWYHVRKWFVDKTMELSLEVVGPLYASVYLSPWYRMLGAKLGDGAEISTASFISPDLLSIGAESFIADNVSLGAPRVRGGVVNVGPNQIGRRAFIGNSSVLPPGTTIGDEVLIGCLSAPPRRPGDALRPDSVWLGSPAILLSQRPRSTDFGEARTFNPPARLRVLRAAIEFVRVITPSTGFIILTSLLFSALLLLHDNFSLTQALLFFPVLYLCCGLVAAAFTILVKWLLVGRYRPGEHPLWSTFVWRNELINALHEHLAGPFLVGALTGTPFLCWYFRLLGARIGRRVYLETTDFTEFDLARIGDEAALNADCTVQTHLFEDRVMKMSHLDIGPRCSVGVGSLVLYDARMEPASRLGMLSLLMKGEVLPAGTAWAGNPARLKP